jgi:secreted PhoX family phosphatase
MVDGGTTAIALSLVSLGLDRRAVADPLVGDPDGILDLPDGFSYKIIDFAGEIMDDGYRVPARPDAMACFSGPNNTLILMRNHEISLGGAGGPYDHPREAPPEAYDPDGRGGVSRVVLDATTYDRISSNLVLVGTARNCAGGPSPWGWLSCEETIVINGEARHGYAFLCPIDAETVQSPQRIDGYGRFNHEAACVDPSTNIAYLTEDRPDGCLYRFVPDRMDEPFVGILQALRIVGEDDFDTGDMNESDVFGVEWVDIEDPDPDRDTVREEGHEKGAARFVRAEGIWFFEGQTYISSTIGGPSRNGQIFVLTDGDHPTLECMVCSSATSVLRHPDYLTVAPWSEVFVCEQGDRDNYIRRVNLVGEVGDFARNAYSSSKLCGVCFSPDGKAMFVNLQNDGLTLVVTGPFPTVGY